MRKRNQKARKGHARPRYGGGEVYYRYVGEHGQRQTHLRESREALMTGREGEKEGKERRERGKRYSNQEANGTNGLDIYRKAAQPLGLEGLR